MKELITKALDFAYEAHRGQKRKYTHEPYITHPIMVMKLLQTLDYPEHVLAAALLHDVIEDTPHTLYEIEHLFGPLVAQIVAFCTEVSTPEYGNRAARKKLDANHYACGCAFSQTLKVADLIDNATSIAKYDPDFWKVFKKEKAHLLSVLTKADKRLVYLAYYLIDAK